MSKTLEKAKPQPPIGAQPLACRLRPKEVIGRRGPVRFMAEIELENLSPLPLEIKHHLTALQFLNLIVHDSRGTVVSEGHFADHFSPTEEELILRLAPGEKFVANVHFFSTLPQDTVPAGTYVVQAIYEYDGFRAESNPVEVTV